MNECINLVNSFLCMEKSSGYQNYPCPYINRFSKCKCGFVPNVDDIGDFVLNERLSLVRKEK